MPLPFLSSKSSPFLLNKDSNLTIIFKEHILISPGALGQDKQKPQLFYNIILVTVLGGFNGMLFSLYFCFTIFSMQLQTLIV